MNPRPRSLLRQLRFQRCESRQMLAGDVAGLVWHDLDLDGQFDSPPEQGISDWQVYVDLNGDGQFNPGEPTDQTDVDGRYRISGVPSGSRIVRAETRSDWDNTFPASDYTLNVPEGGTVSSVNFGRKAQPRPYTEGNLLYTKGTFLTDDLLFEYTTQGELVQAVVIPGSENFSRVIVKDVALDANLRAHMFNGYTHAPPSVDRDIELTTYDPATGAFIDTQVPGWRMGATYSTWGDIAAYDKYLFVNDHDVDNSPHGVIRFNVDDLSWERFASLGEPVDLTIGLDGLLYALDLGDPFTVTNGRAYDPVTLAQVRSFSLPGQQHSIAVDANGHMYGLSDTGLRHFDPDGNVLNSTIDVGGHDIDISPAGQLLIADNFNIDLITLDFTEFSTFATPYQATQGFGFASFVQPPLKPSQPEVVGRHLFYNDSAFDGQSPGLHSLDDEAIASDKSALLPGQTATFENYTSYVHGINGLMIDVAGVPAGAIGAGDFSFRVGNTNSPGSWGAAPIPSSLTVREGEGVNGSHRVTVIWPNGAITDNWLEVTVDRGGIGLANDDIFYFGNAPGEATGVLDNGTDVNAADFLAARGNLANFLSPADIEDAHDFNRDRRVNAVDMAIVRDHTTTTNNRLRLITPSVPVTKQSDPKLRFSSDLKHESGADEESPADVASGNAEIDSENGHEYLDLVMASMAVTTTNDLTNLGSEADREPAEELLLLESMFAEM